MFDVYSISDLESREVMWDFCLDNNIIGVYDYDGVDLDRIYAPISRFAHSGNHHISVSGNGSWRRTVKHNFYYSYSADVCYLGRSVSGINGKFLYYAY